MQIPQHITGLRCTICNTLHAPDSGLLVCPDHDNEGILEVEYDYQQIGTTFTREHLAKSGDFSQWRYRPLLPVLPDTPVPPLTVGWTPLVPAPLLAESVGIGSLTIKDDSRQPTGSLKDRASALAVMKAKEAGARVITTASTGNAAAALAGICASVQMECVIFVPASAPEGKIAQLMAYGATIFLVQGTYDDAFELCLQASSKFGWYNRNTGYNPYMAEGKKTAAFEICEQLDWRVPDSVFVSVGDGCIISGLHKGFKDLLELGWIEKIPRLMGVQSAGSDFMWQASEKNADVLTFPAISANTVADSISAGLPRDRIKAARAVSETGGAWLRVADENILAAIPALASSTGIFAEPAAAASLAGLKEAVKAGLITNKENSVLLVTGNGLKDPGATIKACSVAGSKACTIAPDIDEVGKNLPADLKNNC
ncbi:threonine synthase [Desulfosediminicola ganghwensis]|uniref:threonine synthase n=1 Tax=Desulfosediminicola ganghwensis TaxID=2569540 RepID=UPI0010AD4F61|nr:threonine synthase [Desulfosediminicola ganghwensis]